MSHKFVYGNETTPKTNGYLQKYVALRVFGKENDFGPSGSLGVWDGNRKILGAVIFHGWQPDYGVIELSAAADSPKWLSRRAIREIMGICFDQHKCQQVVSRMATDNARAIKIYDFIGFKKLLLPNMRGRGRDEWLMLLTRDEWAASKLNKEN